MAAVAFDTLKCARRLKDAGYTDQQAEVQAEIMAEAFVFNMDALVTRDYLDARFAEQEARIDGKFSEQGTLFDARLNEQTFNMNLQLAKMDGKLGKLSVMFAVIMAGLSVPIIQTLITWFG